MRTIIAVIAGLVGFGSVQNVGAESQPNSTDILPTAAQLGPEWTSNRVVVMVDPLCSPKEVADMNESSGWLEIAHDILRKEPRRESYTMARYYGSFRTFRTNDWCTNFQALVWITRWKSEDDVGKQWEKEKDNATKNPPRKLPKIGEEVHSFQRGGMHNDIAFRRGRYLITVEGGSTVYGWDHLVKLAEVLDRNLLKPLGKRDEPAR